MARYEIGSRVSVEHLRVGDPLGEHIVREVLYDSTGDRERPGEEVVEVIVAISGGHLRLSGHGTTLVVPVLRALETRTDPGDPEWMRVRCYALRDAHLRPRLRSGPVLMYPTPGGRWLWRYPDDPAAPATDLDTTD